MERFSFSLAGQTHAGRREFGQILIRLLCCIHTSRAANEVGVNVHSWDVF